MTVHQQESWTGRVGTGGAGVGHDATLTPGADSTRDPSGHNERMSDAASSGDTEVEQILAKMPYGMGDLNKKMGIELVEVTRDRLVATMPVQGNTQPYGLLHGGASVVLAESLGSVGSAIHAYPDRVAVGVDINATHHRAVSSGTVTATATPAHLGRTSTSFEVVITNEAGKRVCTARITCALIPAENLG